MQFFFLVKAELRREIRKIRLSLKEKKILSSYIVFSISIGIFTTVLHTFLFRLTDNNNNLLIRNNSLMIGEILLITFRLWAVFNFFKVFYTNYIVKWFESPDLDLLFCAPVKSNELFLSKYIKILIKHIIILMIMFVITTPVFLYLKTKWNVVILLFTTLLLFIESIYLFSIMTFLNIEFNYKKYRILILGLSILSYLLILKHNSIPFIDYIYRNIPSSILVNVVLQLIQEPIQSFNISIEITKLLSITLMLISLIYLFKRNYYESVFNSFKNSEQKRRKYISSNILPSAYYQTSSFILTIKDMVIYLRENLSEFLIYLLLNYGAILFLFQAYNISKNFFSITNEYNSLLFFISPFILIIILTMNTTSIESYNNELGNIWITKASPYKINKIVIEKFIYNFLITIILNIPIYFSVILLIKTLFSKIIMVALIMEIVLIHNVIGILISATHSSITVKNKKLPLISYFTQFITMIIISSSSIMLVNFKLFQLYAINIILISLLITKYDKPLIYYLIDITSTIYVISIIAFLSLNIVFLGSLMIRLLILRDFYLDFSITMASIVAIFLKTSVITRVCLKLTEKAFIENENLI